MEIMNMPHVPKDFEVLYETVSISSNLSEIKKAYEQLLANTEELILTEQKKGRMTASFIHNVSGLYEEMINCYNKIEHALEIGDNTTALFAAVQLTHEFEVAA
jgi:hypothetical protein